MCWNFLFVQRGGPHWLWTRGFVFWWLWWWCLRPSSWSNPCSAIQTVLWVVTTVDTDILVWLTVFTVQDHKQLNTYILASAQNICASTQTLLANGSWELAHVHTMSCMCPACTMQQYYMLTVTSTVYFSSLRMLWTFVWECGMNVGLSSNGHRNPQQSFFNSTASTTADLRSDQTQHVCSTLSWKSSQCLKWAINQQFFCSRVCAKISRALTPPARVAALSCLWSVQYVTTCNSLAMPMSVE